MKLFPDHSECFVCGRGNRKGLRISFSSDGGKARAEFIPESTYQGYRGILHGGILSTLLDEVMIQAVLASGIQAVTTRIEVRFKSPARIGEKLLLEGEVIENRRKIIKARGRIFREDGSVVAAAEGRFFPAEGRRNNRPEKKTRP